MNFNQSLKPRYSRGKQLEPFYYRDHFVEMLEFVEEHYEHVLGVADQAFLSSFQALDELAQALYVRLVNRKGTVFSCAKLNYPEIGKLNEPLTCLRSAGFISEPGPHHFSELLKLLTKSEIHRILSLKTAGLPKTILKNELVELALATCEPESFLSQCNPSRLIVQRKTSTVQYLMFLYFGKTRDGMDSFALRDLGLVQPADLKTDYEPRFQDEEGAREHFYFASRLLKVRQKSPSSCDIHILVREARQWPEPVSAGAAKLRDRLAWRLGSIQEKQKDLKRAIELYRYAESTRCTERAIRLMLKLGDRDSASTCLLSCMETPRNDEEALFARDLYARTFKGKRTLATTDVLKAASTIEIDEQFVGSPEKAAVAWFAEKGMRAYHCENALWRMLFGMVFWDMLFSNRTAEIHSPFDTLPQSLATGLFYTSYTSAVDKRLAQVNSRARLKLTLLKVATEKFGTRNGVFRWRQSTLDALFVLVEEAPLQAVENILRLMCKNYPLMRSGYPDLLLVDDHGVKFVEIKSEGDSLRRHQLAKLQQLTNAGFRAEVVATQWTLDPRQAYVVVDVETTGGRGDQHRVTEIGAVKVVNGKIVDQFSTLLNPGRSVPPAITRLTGISQTMVDGAPRFEQIADALADFLGNAIFVAHNVAFDYGFIGREFRRIGRRFKMARLCTVAGMRRHYPGHASYSLAALTKAYGISLETHHRALCDAEAAAQLLLLINDKRSEKQRPRQREMDHLSEIAEGVV
ncbi:MAG: exonuclease domain-containing protein [Gammaproteobacteria bacterium]